MNPELFDPAEPGNTCRMTAAPSEFQLEAVRVDRVTTLFVRGELDLAAAPELGRALAGLAVPGGELVVDLRETDFADCAVIGVLLTARRSQRALGGTLRCTQAGGAVRRALEVTGADRLLGG